MDIVQKEERTFRIMIIAILIVIIGLLVLALMNKEAINTFVQRNIFKNPDYLTDEEKGCPSTLALFNYADHMNTTDLSDDNYYISIVNRENRSYHAEVFVNDIFERKLILLPNSTTPMKSKIITEWWRRGVVEENIVQEEEREDSIEEEEGGNNELFYIDIKIEGCSEKIIPLTPNAPVINAPNIGGGGGGEEASPSSRYSISIAKDYIFYLPD